MPQAFNSLVTNARSWPPDACPRPFKARVPSYMHNSAAADTIPSMQCSSTVQARRKVRSWAKAMLVSVTSPHALHAGTRGLQAPAPNAAAGVKQH